MKTIFDTHFTKARALTDRFFYSSYSFPVYRKSQPRIPMSMVTKHAHQVDYDTWSKVVSVYFEEILNLLMEGEAYKLPLGMGTIQLGVVRRLKVDKIKGRDNNAYVPTLFWFKGKKNHNCTIKNKKILRMEFAKPAFMKIFRLIKDDPYSVFKWYKDPYADSMFVDSKRKVQRW